MAVEFFYGVGNSWNFDLVIIAWAYGTIKSYFSCLRISYSAKQWEVDKSCFCLDSMEICLSKGLKILTFIILFLSKFILWISCFISFWRLCTRAEILWNLLFKSRFLVLQKAMWKCSLSILEFLEHVKFTLKATIVLITMPNIHFMVCSF